MWRYLGGFAAVGLMLAGGGVLYTLTGAVPIVTLPPGFGGGGGGAMCLPDGGGQCSPYVFPDGGSVGNIASPGAFTGAATDTFISNQGGGLPEGRVGMLTAGSHTGVSYWSMNGAYGSTLNNWPDGGSFAFLDNYSYPLWAIEEVADFQGNWKTKWFFAPPWQYPDAGFYCVPGYDGGCTSQELQHDMELDGPTGALQTWGPIYAGNGGTGPIPQPDWAGGVFANGEVESFSSVYRFSSTNAPVGYVGPDGRGAQLFMVSSNAYVPTDGGGFGLYDATTGGMVLFFDSRAASRAIKTYAVPNDGGAAVAGAWSLDPGTGATIQTSTLENRGAITVDPDSVNVQSILNLGYPTGGNGTELQYVAYAEARGLMSVNKPYNAITGFNQNDTGLGSWVQYYNADVTPGYVDFDWTAPGGGGGFGTNEFRMWSTGELDLQSIAALPQASVPTCGAANDGLEVTIGGLASGVAEKTCRCKSNGSSVYQWCSLTWTTASTVLCTGGSSTVCP